MSSQLPPDHTTVGHQPDQGGGLKERITEFAQRKPGAFLAAAAVVGFVTGRLLRGSSGDDDDGGGAPGGGEAVALLIPRDGWSA